MPKAKTTYYCTACGYETPRWQGRCPSCGEWNTIEEVPAEERKAAAKASSASVGAKNPPVKLRDIKITSEDRIPTGISEFDNVLGGGIVRGSLVLLGGDPGIGKSTLLMQACDNIASAGFRILYVSGEESAAQLKLRAKRLGIKSDEFYIMAGTDVDAATEQATELLPDVIVIDSIQTMRAEQVSSMQGSVSQIRETSARLQRLAKDNNIAIFLVGHVTKEGSLAGPRVLEHLVDTVLYFEGDSLHQFRILRAAKNRFGSTNEIGVFEMAGNGMRGIENPSALLLSQRSEPVAGCAVTCVLEGTRTVLVEIQALAGQTSFANPRRMSDGIDYNRLCMLLAVLEKRAGLPLYNQDVYVNVAGGLNINEPCADLAAMAAIISSVRGRPLSNMAIMGEIGLTGEVRPISQIERRIQECRKMGINEIVIPKNNMAGLPKFEGTYIHSVANVYDMIKKLISD